MALAFTLTNAVYLFMASSMPTNIWLISLCMVVKFLGLGFGTTAYAVSLIAFSRDGSGEMRPERFAVCSSVMALATLLFTTLSGYLQEWLGYYRFFWLVVLCSLVTWVVTFLAKVDASAGKKSV
jgi:PAT family beta-lactamase induction signal transducer AmpG